MSYQLISESESWYHGLSNAQKTFIIEYYGILDMLTDMTYANMIIEAYKLRDHWHTVQGWPESKMIEGKFVS